MLQKVKYPSGVFIQLCSIVIVSIVYFGNLNLFSLLQKSKFL